MRRSVFGLVFILLVSSLSYGEAAMPKAGSKCLSQWKITTVKSGTFTCMKVGKKFLWLKGKFIRNANSDKPSSASPPALSPTPSPIPSTKPSPIPIPSPTYDINTFVFDDICQKDPFIPSQWKLIEERINARGVECSWPYRIVKKIMPRATPNSTLLENLQSNSECKLQSHPSRGPINAWPIRAVDFWTKYERHISKNTVINLIPIYSPDAPDNGKNPLDDYKQYLDFLAEWVVHATEGEGKLVIRSPNRYIEFPDQISAYGLVHERPEYIAERFRSALEKYVVPKIDLNEANVGLILLPAGSDFSLSQQVGLGQIRFGNNFVKLSIFPPFSPERISGTGTNFVHPAWWLHELHHATSGLDDNDQKSDDGLHMWGLMSYGANEMLGWQKWIMGLWDDERINCVDTNKGGTFWIAPNTYQTKLKKLIVIRTSPSNVIVVESMRAGGLNYKMPSWMEGALVYRVENTNPETHSGSYVLKPEQRKLLSPTFKGLSRQFTNSDAALKSGESTSYDGWKITVVESGSFGDVIRVERLIK